jgi:hypothetical protein
VDHPRAREISRPAREIVGSDVVLFECDTMHYYRMHEPAYRVWISCDGTRSHADLAKLVFQRVDAETVAFVDLAVDELRRDGLVLPGEVGPGLSVDRRRAARMLVGGLLGTMVASLVSSITAPDAAAALSCTGGWEGGHGCFPGEGPNCDFCCCCSSSSTNIGFCAYSEENAEACRMSDNNDCY